MEQPEMMSEETGCCTRSAQLKSTVGLVAALLGILLALLAGWPLLCNQWSSYNMQRQQRELAQGHARRADAAQENGETALAVTAMSFATRAQAVDPAMERRAVVLQLRQGAEQPGSIAGNRLLELSYLLRWAEEEELGEPWLRLTLRANLLGAQGKQLEAIAALREAVQQNAGNVLPLFLLAELLRAAERFDEAESTLQRLLVVEPRHEGARLALGSIHLRAKKPEEAERVLRPLLEGQPSALAQGLLGIALSLQKKHDEALPLLQRSLSLDPQQAEVARQLGTAALALKRIGEALRGFEAAYRLQATPENLFNLGRVQRLAGKPAEALESLQLFLQARPDHAVAQRELAGALEELGRKDQALGVYRGLSRALARVEGGEELRREVEGRIAVLGAQLTPTAPPPEPPEPPGRKGGR